MKSKLRKIVVDEHEYLYNVGERWHEGSEITRMSLKVYLNGYRNTPVFIDFTVYIDYFGGLPLNHGVKLLNKESNKEDLLNINEPGFVRKIIILARGRGWNGNNKVDNQNGNDYLRELGYEVGEIIRCFFALLIIESCVDTPRITRVITPVLDVAKPLSDGLHLT